MVEGASSKRAFDTVRHLVRRSFAPPPTPPKPHPQSWPQQQQDQHPSRVRPSGGTSRYVVRSQKSCRGLVTPTSTAPPTAESIRADGITIQNTEKPMEVRASNIVAAIGE